MAKYVHMYSFCLAFENFRRQSPTLGIKKPTLMNIFDEERFEKIRRNAFFEKFLRGAESTWVN